MRKNKKTKLTLARLEGLEQDARKRSKEGQEPALSVRFSKVSVRGVHRYTVYRYPLRHLREDHEVIPVLRSLLTDNPPGPGRVGHTTGFYVPYSFRTVVWVLLRPTRTR